MTPLEPSDQPALDTAARAGEHAEHAGMRALVARQRGVRGLRRVVVHALAGLLLGGDRRQHRVRAEAARDPGEHVRAPARPALAHREARLFELGFPELGVTILGGGEAQVEIGDLVARLGGRHRAVQVRGVDLVLPEPAIALDVRGGRGRAFVRHRHPQRIEPRRRGGNGEQPGCRHPNSRSRQPPVRGALTEAATGLTIEMRGHRIEVGCGPSRS